MQARPEISYPDLPGAGFGQKFGSSRIAWLRREDKIEMLFPGHPDFLAAPAHFDGLKRLWCFDRNGNDLAAATTYVAARSSEHVTLTFKGERFDEVDDAQMAVLTICIDGVTGDFTEREMFVGADRAMVAPVLQDLTIVKHLINVPASTSLILRARRIRWSVEALGLAPEIVSCIDEPLSVAVHALFNKHLANNGLIPPRVKNVLITDFGDSTSCANLLDFDVEGRGIVPRASASILVCCPS